jgi:F-type H+-transporting ATPase subunit alpha
MKKVAGPLRIGLAQYRELAAFAQFASELDATTRRLLARGERTVEVLKQDQYAPMSVEEQVLAIFAATSGLLDDLAVADIRRFEKELLSFFHTQKSELLTELREKKELTDEMTQKLTEAIEEFKETFGPSEAALPEAAVDKEAASEEQAPSEESGGPADEQAADTG